MSSNLSFAHNESSFQSSILPSGISTRTTTLTSAALQNIEESFMDLQTLPPSDLQNQAGFVPPVTNMSLLSQNSDSNNSFDSDYSSKQEESQWYSSCMQSTSPNILSGSTSTSSGKTRSGGRRSSKQERLSPEEEERRRVRRERNKLAAARCRKRRLDHTNCLLIETEGLEEKRHSLQNEIQLLNHQKDELEFLLEAHRANCKHGGVNPGGTSGVPIAPPQSSLSAAQRTMSASLSQNKVMGRPNSLPVSNNYNNIALKRENDFSNVISPNSFEWLMSGDSGLTPLGNGQNPHAGSAGFTSMISSCSGQQRSSSSDLSSPDTISPPKLVSL